MRDHHEPYFGRIEEFLKSPINREIADLYHEVVDELRSKIAVDQDKFKSFEEILVLILDSAKENPDLRSRRRTLNILLRVCFKSYVDMHLHK